jgi:hypothetical protein
LLQTTLVVLAPAFHVAEEQWPSTLKHDETPMKQVQEIPLKKTEYCRRGS